MTAFFKIPVLTIAASDPSGGAGLQADLKTFHEFGVYGMGVLTLLTVQNTKGITKTKSLGSRWVQDQLKTLLADIPPRAVKTGALGKPEIVLAVTRGLKKLSCPLVVDPVMSSKKGFALLNPSARKTMVKNLFPQTTLVTPNIDEAEIFTGLFIQNLDAMKEAARKIQSWGPKAVLVKGGHLRGKPCDVLYHKNRFTLFKSLRLPSSHTHGTGCALSAAITAELAKGRSLMKAVDRAKKFVFHGIKTAPRLGKGNGPLNLHTKKPIYSLG